MPKDYFYFVVSGIPYRARNLSKPKLDSNNKRSQNTSEYNDNQRCYQSMIKTVKTDSNCDVRDLFLQLLRTVTPKI